MWLRFAERWARGSGAGAAAQEASASAATSSLSGRVRERMTRRAHGSRAGAVTAQHHPAYPALTPAGSSPADWRPTCPTPHTLHNPMRPLG
ncbi:unnamed protein product [Parnassius apollo]|uniref:(apollo) hypothetical protein n=1 Tax=Parnassius apollo TaxID=110799 RepID=A0A8S3Y8F0_PARAO|nr:unnamed protein product [Parnassius apollo]